MSRRAHKIVLWVHIIAAAAFIGGFCLLFVGCTSTVIPHRVEASAASWDGNEQNSGFLGSAPDKGAYITPHAKARYDALVEVYGSKFVPPVQVGDGLRPATNNFYIDAQHLSNFATMNRWRKEGVKP